MQRDKNWLETELQSGLQRVSAPAELWDRVQSAQAVRATTWKQAHRALVWAIAAVALLFAAGLSEVKSASNPQFAGLRCQNPAELRAWVRANTGLDVPLRASLAPVLQVQGARSVANGVEIAYRTGNHDGALFVSRADGAANVPHDRAAGSVSNWVRDGQRYTLASDSPADLQLACKLCHLD
jgi:hypothetical protein